VDQSGSKHQISYRLSTYEHMSRDALNEFRVSYHRVHSSRARQSFPASCCYSSGGTIWHGTTVFIQRVRRIKIEIAETRSKTLQTIEWPTIYCVCHCVLSMSMPLHNSCHRKLFNSFVFLLNEQVDIQMNMSTHHAPYICFELLRNDAEILEYPSYILLYPNVLK
jgi:hypothetical protein